MRRTAAVMLSTAAACVAWATPATAMTIGVQDQGADPAVVQRTAQDMGATNVRVVVTTQDPQVQLVRRYRALGLSVQAAIVVKRATTPAEVLATVRAWHGMVRTVSVGNEPELNGVPACAYVRLFNRVAPRLKRMGIIVGFGEFSPVMAFEYVQQIGRCHGRIRADFVGVHPYQFFSDPLSAPSERSGVGTWLGLGNLGAFKRALRRAHLPVRLRATEFSYLTSGRYKVSMAKATAMWPRAIAQARKHVDELVLYGIGTVPAGTWGSASLLDSNGHRTPAYLALAKALGRVLAPEHVPPVPSLGLLPDGTTEHWPVAPAVKTSDAGGQSDDDAPETAPVGAGASTTSPEDAPDAPVVITDPSVNEGPADAVPVPPVEQTDPAPPHEETPDA